MPALADSPPVLPPLTINDIQIDLAEFPSGHPLSRSASLPNYSVSSHQPPVYDQNDTRREEFYTIPLYENAQETPPQSDRKGAILIVCFLLLAFMSFSAALVVCILLSVQHGPPIAAPIPLLLFAMSGFLVISGGFFVKGVSLWLQRRARRNVASKTLEVKEQKVEIYVEGLGGVPQNGGTK